MKVVKPPHEYSVEADPVLFLGGSIEMGAAENWQARIAEDLKDFDILILDPRRDDWDSTWKQDPTPGTKFHEQVSWEMESQDIADFKVYYFDPKTKSPITLLEIGLYGTADDTIVCCPKEFWRYGNVAMVCERYGIPLVHTYEEMIDHLKDLF